MRKKIVAGNWKMNKDWHETKTLIDDLKAGLPKSNAEIMIAPAHINLFVALQTTMGSTIEVIAQNMHFADKGAYTGEISADMLRGININTVILGHSERRSYFGENDQDLTKKINIAIEKKMRIIFCFGEQWEDRKSNRHFSVVENQLKSVLFHLAEDAWQHIILAYEPVWAIGTGETASAEQAQKMHNFIRNLLAKQYHNTIATNTSILYGGSVKPDNAKDIFSQPDVDGGLIGGASLNAKDFISIIKAI